MVKVLITADSKYPVNRPKIRAAVEATLREKGITSDVEISVLICGERKSRELAKKYLADDSAHNVLSFPLADEGSAKAFTTGKNAADFSPRDGEFLILGDIIVCYPLAQNQANSDNVLVDTKISELVSHGMLHLLGVHHDVLP